MRKIKLQLDTLRVESYETSRASEVAGTVRAHGSTEWGEPTCDITCDGGCPTYFDETCRYVCP